MTPQRYVYSVSALCTHVLRHLRPQLHRAVRHEVGDAQQRGVGARQAGEGPGLEGRSTSRRARAEYAVKVRSRATTIEVAAHGLVQQGMPAFSGIQ